MVSLVEIEALTSVGLVRRAQKALVKSEFSWAEKSGEIWQFSFAGQQGKYNINHLQDSRCNCPASGVCKHIVAAAIFASEADKTGTVSTEFVLPDFTQSEMFKSAGKSVSRSAYRFFSKAEDSLISETNINQDHCEILWNDQRAIITSESTIDSIIIESGDNDKRLIAAIFLLKYQNKVIDWPQWLFDELETKQNESRKNTENIIEQVKNSLFKISTLGVSNIKPANMIDMTGLVPALNSTGNRQIANAVRSLQEWVNLNESGIGLNPEEHILRQMGELFSLCDSTKADHSSVVNIDDSLGLICVGGHKWSTASGATGLNMLFVSASGKLYHSGLLRNQKGSGFSADKAWSNMNLWSGSPINYQLPGQYLTLDGAELNRWGALKLTDNTHYSSLPEKTFNIKALTDWENLKQVSLYDYSLIKPQRWIYCEFNELSQLLELQLEDVNGQILSVRQYYSADHASRISNTIDIWKENPEYLVIRHTHFNHAHQFEPVSFYTNKWISLDFFVPQKSSLSLLERLISKFVKYEEFEQVDMEGGVIALLRNLQNTLIEYPHMDTQKLEILTDQFKALGLDSIARKIKRIDSGEDFLKMIYIANTMDSIASPWPVYARPDN